MNQSNTNYNEIQYYKMKSFHLENHPEIMETLYEQGLKDDTLQWVLQEKIHGSNSCFIHQYLDGTSYIDLGRRNGIVPKKEYKSFFNIQEAYQPYIKSLTELAETACYEWGLDFRNHRVIIYSELYGKNIQKGMNYHNKETIAVFDIRIDDTFMSLKNVENLCYRYAIPFAPIVLKGKLNELIEKFVPKLENMKSLVPIMLHDNNIFDAPAEGVILRPYDLNQTYDSYNTKQDMLRYKWKKSEFSENPVKKKLTSTEANTIDLLISNATKFINIRRLETYISKVGNEFIMDKKNIGHNIRALFQDASYDIEQDEEYQFIFQDKKLLRQLRQKLIQESSKVIQNYQFEYDQIVAIPNPISYNKLDEQIANTQLTIDQIRQQVMEIKKKNVITAY